MTAAPKELTPRKKAPNGTKATRSSILVASRISPLSRQRRSIAHSLRIFPFGQRFVCFESRLTHRVSVHKQPGKSNDIPNNAKEAAMGFLFERTDIQNAIFVGKDVLKKDSNQYDRASI
jgi:hypothetical protein